MKKINENTKVTLTVGQLKKLVKESNSGKSYGWINSAHERLYVINVGTFYYPFGADSVEALIDAVGESDLNVDKDLIYDLWYLDKGKSFTSPKISAFRLK